MAQTQNTVNEARQAEIWRVRIALVEQQAIVVQCVATLSAIEAMDREHARSWETWQTIEDRATLARTMRRNAEIRIAQLTARLGAL
jgi:hypothetical protein